jgi:nudix-type nucleoside diphosphatase (YffH/AdpP family)
VNSTKKATVVEEAEVSADGVDRNRQRLGRVVCGHLPLFGNAFQQPAMAIFDQLNIFHVCMIMHETARLNLFIVQRFRTVDVMTSTLPTSNPGVRINRVDVLSDNWYTLRRIDFDYRSADGSWRSRQREAYDRGNGATVLLIDWTRETVVLTRQFRVPAYMNAHPDGMLIETPAGLLDDDDAETAIRREVEEETGYRVSDISHLFELYMSPGSVTERVSFFAAEYDQTDRVAEGGGVEAEGEEIEVVEVTLDEALTQVTNRHIVDGKTVLLLQWAAMERVRRQLA